MNLVAKILATTLAHGEDIAGVVAAFEAEILAIAKGEGGAQKIANAATATAGLAASVAKIAADVAPVV